MEDRTQGWRQQSGPEIMSTEQSRSGEVSGHLRWMLAAGTGLVVAAFAIIYFVFFTGH